MYTLDQFIQRLQDLREIADQGGETPVAVPARNNDEWTFEVAAVEIQNTMEPEQGPDGIVWNVKPKGNTNQVISVI